MECKIIKLLVSFVILLVMMSYLPVLAHYITFNGMLGIMLGIIYVKDSRGRFHYGYSGRYVSNLEGIILSMFLPIMGIIIPLGITIYSLPLYAIEQLIAATFGAEVIGLAGGSFMS